MCQFQQGQDDARNNWQEHARRQEQLYPNLQQVLDSLMNQDNQSQFLRDFFAGRPSAPESDSDTGYNQESVGGWQMPNNQDGQARTDQDHGRQSRSRNDFNDNDDLTRLFQRLGQKLACKFAKSLGFFALLLPIILAPNCLLVLGIFTAILKSLGIPLVPMVMAGLCLEILKGLDPILITLLAIWSLYKVCIQKQPLIDVNYWRSRIQFQCEINGERY